MADQRMNAEHWWPRLSIDSKHAILADPEGELPDGVRREIAGLGGDAPERLAPGDVQFIRTQIEAVD